MQLKLLPAQFNSLKRLLAGAIALKFLHVLKDFETSGYAALLFQRFLLCGMRVAFRCPRLSACNLPPYQPMTLTKIDIERGLTARGGYRLTQLKALGYVPPRPGQFPSNGWKKRLIGREVSEAQYREFLRLSDGGQLSVLPRVRNPDAFHRKKQPLDTSRDQMARDYANAEWEHHRESFERIPTPSGQTAVPATG